MIFSWCNTDIQLKKKHLPVVEINSNNINACFTILLQFLQQSEEIKFVYMNYDEPVYKKTNLTL